MEQSNTGSLEDLGYADQHGQILNNLQGLAPTSSLPSGFQALMNAKLTNIKTILTNEQAEFQGFLLERLPGPEQMQRKMRNCVTHLREMHQKIIVSRPSTKVTELFGLGCSQLLSQADRLGEPYTWREVSQQTFHERSMQLLRKVQLILDTYADFGNLLAHAPNPGQQQNERRVTSATAQQTTRGTTPGIVQSNGLGRNTTNHLPSDRQQQTQPSFKQPEPQLQKVQPSQSDRQNQQTQKSAKFHHRHHHRHHSHHRHHHKRHERQAPYPSRGLSQLPMAQSTHVQHQRDTYFSYTQTDTQELGWSKVQEEATNTHQQLEHRPGSPYTQGLSMGVQMNGMLHLSEDFNVLNPSYYEHTPNEANVPLLDGSLDIPDQTIGLPQSNIRRPQTQRSSLPQYLRDELTDLNEQAYLSPNGYLQLPDEMIFPQNGYLPSIAPSVRASSNGHLEQPALFTSTHLDDFEQQQVNQFPRLPPYSSSPMPPLESSKSDLDAHNQQHPQLQTSSIVKTFAQTASYAEQPPTPKLIRRNLAASKPVATAADVRANNAKATNAPTLPSNCAMPSDLSTNSQNPRTAASRIATPLPSTNLNTQNRGQALQMKPPSQDNWRPDLHYVFLWGLFMDRGKNSFVAEEMKRQFPGLSMPGEAWLERERLWMRGDVDGEGKKNLVGDEVPVRPLETVLVQVAVRRVNSVGGRLGCEVDVTGQRSGEGGSGSGSG